LRKPVIKWLAIAMMVFGILPFISLAIANAITWLSGCTTSGTGDCPLYETLLGKIVAILYLLGWYMLVTIPIGLVGAVMYMFNGRVIPNGNKS